MSYFANQHKLSWFNRLINPGSGLKLQADITDLGHAIMTNECKSNVSFTPAIVKTCNNENNYPAIYISR